MNMIDAIGPTLTAQNLTDFLELLRGFVRTPFQFQGSSPEPGICRLANLRVISLENGGQAVTCEISEVSSASYPVLGGPLTRQNHDRVIYFMHQGSLKVVYLDKRNCILGVHVYTPV